MTTNTKYFLFEFMDNETSVAHLEQWINGDNELKSTHPTLHQDLHLFDFGGRDASHGIKEKIRPYIGEKEFNIWRTKRLLTKIVDDKIDIVLGTRKLKELYFETGEKFIPAMLGVGFESELDNVPTPEEYHMWNEKDLKEILKKADSYRERIKRSARDFLATLRD